MKPNKQTTIQTLLASGKGQREIARVTGIDRKTIRRYQRQFALANSPGGGDRPRVRIVLASIEPETRGRR